MKLIIAFLVAGIISSYASDSYSQNKKISINLKDASIKEVFNEVEKNTEFIIIYYDDILDLNRKVNITVRNQTVDKVLEKVFETTDNSYQIIDRQIVITRKAPPQVSSDPSHVDNLISDSLSIIQQVMITGIVTNDKGQPLPGVNIVVKGTAVGMITDLEGKFQLILPESAEVLVFSFIGMKTQEISIENKTVFNIIMEEEAVGMEEVVVVGYGLQKKESIVGAISQASGENIRQNIQGADLGTALSGAVPGLISLRQTGRPGGADLVGNSANYSSLLIRGQTTWNNAQPLVLIDGVEREYHQINPYEIEKISVLKDASATSVFGVKGANGVILITTYRGKEGKAKLTFDGSTTVKVPSKMPELASIEETLKHYNYGWLHELANNEQSWDLIWPQKWIDMTVDQTYPYYLPNVDWREVILKDYTLDYNANLTLSGGTKFVKYFGALSFMEETDMLNIRDIGQGFDPSNNFKRINFRSNLDFTITPSTQFSVNLSGSFYNQRRTNDSSQAYRAIWGTSPVAWPVKYQDGVYGFGGATWNCVPAVRDLHYGGYTAAKGTNITTDYILTQKLNSITPGLSVSAKLSYDYRDRNTQYVGGATPYVKWIDRKIVDAISPGMTEAEIAELEKKYTTYTIPAVSHVYDWAVDLNSVGSESSEAKDVYRSLFYQLSLNYNRDFGKHAVSGLALVSRQESATGSIFPSYREDWVGRATYGYDKRYLLEINAAYNGSEKFARKNRFGFFPSFALGWIVSNESLFETLKPVFSNLKFRYSDGKVGSDAGIARWLYAGSWAILTDRIFFGAPVPANSYPMRREDVIPNEDIHWEVSHKRDLGIETGFFSNQLTVNFDYFIQNRSDIFLSASQITIPIYFGASPVAANLGKVDSHGWELETQFKKVTSEGITYWLSYAWSFAKDKIIYRNDPQLRPAYQKSEGYQIGQTRGYTSNHAIINTWDDVYNNVGFLTAGNNTSRRPGNFGIVDYNGDGVIDTNDSVPMSYPSVPQYSYSPALGASYKNWNASMRLFGIYNVNGNITDNYLTFASGGATIQDPVLAAFYAEEMWSPEMGNTTTAKRANINTVGVSGINPSEIESRAYLRCESAEIAYTLNRSNAPFLQRMGVNNLRLILSGNNLFIITKMRTDRDNYDLPATSSDIRFYPVLRRYNIGLSLDF